MKRSKVDTLDNYNIYSSFYTLYFLTKAIDVVSMEIMPKTVSKSINEKEK